MIRLGITGATGFLGGNFLSHVLSDCPTIYVRCIVRHATNSKIHPTADYLVGDLMNEADCEEFVEGLDTIVHFAQSNSPALSDRHWSSDLLANITPGLNLLDALRRRKGDACHIVFASSGGAVYGRQASGKLAFQESDECKPLNPYGIQKLALEHYFRTACEQGWLRATIMRISNAYGELLATERRQGLIGVAMARVMADQPVKVFGSLDTVRDYVHVKDVVRAFSSAIYCQQPEDVFRTFNISDGMGHSVAEVLELIGQVTGRIIKTEISDFGHAAISLLPRVVLDNGKAHHELGWAPKITLLDGIRGMIQK